MDIDPHLAELAAIARPEKAAEMAAYHKVDRPYLGVSVPDIQDLADAWRAGLSVDDRLSLASALWQTNIHEARIAAAKLLTQARIRPDDAVWELIRSWVPDFDAWAIADHVSKAGERRLLADPSRIDTVETWVTSPHMWTRRAALVMTLPWTKQNFPKDHDLIIRARVLGWCAELAPDRDWFIQKAIAWWLRDLSKHDAEATKGFLAAHGQTLKPFAAKEAARHLSTAE
ncbi:MAG: DNA alkylation repair protein [Tabrizicola sp.]